MRLIYRIFVGPPYVWDYIYFSPVNLPYLSLTIRPSKEPRRKEGKSFLPLQQDKLDFQVPGLGYFGLCEAN